MEEKTKQPKIPTKKQPQRKRLHNYYSLRKEISLSYLILHEGIKSLKAFSSLFDTKCEHF